MTAVAKQEQEPRRVDDPSKYVVVAPYVTIATMQPQIGRALTGFFKGAPVPADADPEVIARMEDDHLVVRVADPATAAVPVYTPQEEQDMWAEGKTPHVEAHKAVTAAEAARPSRRPAAKEADSKKEPESKGDGKAPEGGAGGAEKQTPASKAPAQPGTKAAGPGGSPSGSAPQKQ